MSTSERTVCPHGQLARQCLLCEQAAEIERLRAVLHVLLDVCRRMDSDNPDVRPCKTEYRTALANGYWALADAALAAKEE